MGILKEISGKIDNFKFKIKFRSNEEFDKKNGLKF
jgi:hypothetical protein